MPSVESKLLSSLFRSSAAKLAKNSTSYSAPAAVAAAAATAATTTSSSATLKQFVSAISISPDSFESCSAQPLPDPQSHLDSSSSFSSKQLSNVSAHRLLLQDAEPADSDESARLLTREVSSLLCGDTDINVTYSEDELVNSGENSPGETLDIPWISLLQNNKISPRQKEKSKERKQVWFTKKTLVNRFNRLVQRCGQQLGLGATLQVFGKLGRENTRNDYNALLTLCIEKARETDDEEVQSDQNYKAYQLFQSMREKGFQIDEEIYGPFMKYLVDYGMVQEFYFFSDLFKHENPASLPRLAYYEMLLCIKLNNQDKIQELCYENALQDDEDKFPFQESYILALSECGRRRELLTLLEEFDITKISSVERLGNIFKSLGKLLLESYAERFILALKTDDTGAENLSSFIYSYASSIPSLAVEDVVAKFNQLHSELEVTPAPVQYEKLIKHCCELLEVHVALDIVDEISDADFTLTQETLLFLLEACERSCEYNLVRRIYSLMQRYKVKPSAESFRCMISLSMRMKDFEGAYNLISDFRQMGLMPTTSMYNAIMVGYFREKNPRKALMVLKQMEDEDLRPDCQTFSYLIGNCNSEEDIIKFCNELEHSGVQVSKHVFMALINAYTACEQFEKAKQVVLDKRIPLKNLNEVKSVLVSALASHGQMTDALTIYEEIKQAECNLEPKAVISLIEHLQSEGELHRLLQLLEELKDPYYWIDGCNRVTCYCVNHNHLRPAVHLLKQLRDKYIDDKVATENLFVEVFCQFAENEPKDMQFGLDLLQAIKEELGVSPSREVLDFLLGACVSAKDIKTAFVIWKEYELAGLPYDVTSFLRMYRTLLALGDHKSARKILKRMPKDDPHVCIIIKVFQATYASHRGTKKKNTKKVGLSSIFL